MMDQRSARGVDLATAHIHRQVAGRVEDNHQIIEQVIWLMSLSIFGRCEVQV